MAKSYHIIRTASAIILVLLLITVRVFAQSKPAKAITAPDLNTILVTAFPYKGETLPMVTLKEFDVVALRVFKNEKDKKAYLKLKRDVRKAYPYAILAGVKLREYDALLLSMPEKKRGNYLKKVEKELMAQFEADLKKLTMNQGRILIRLINRETGMTTYKVIKDYRGSFNAVMWQSFAFLFGNNLKTKYNPDKGEDKLIEEIIQQIEDGEV